MKRPEDYRSSTVEDAAAYEAWRGQDDDVDDVDPMDAIEDDEVDEDEVDEDEVDEDVDDCNCHDPECPCSGSKHYRIF